MKQMTEIETIDTYFMSWSAVFVGVFITLIAALLLNLLGAGVGFFMFSPTGPIKPFGIATFIWFVLSGMLSTYLGAWIAGRMGNAQSTLGASIYGTLVAGMVTFISLILMVTTASVLFTSSFSLLSNMISVSKSVVSGSASFIEKGAKEMKNVAPGLTEKIKGVLPDLQPAIDEINEKAQALIPEGKEKKEEIKKRLERLVKAYLNSDEMTDEKAKEELINSLVEITGDKEEKINRIVEEWYQTYTEAKEKMLQAAEDTANKTAGVLSQMAWMNFFILLGTLLAAIVGAAQGVNTRYRDEAL